MTRKIILIILFLPLFKGMAQWDTLDIIKNGKVKELNVERLPIHEQHVWFTKAMELNANDFLNVLSERINVNEYDQDGQTLLLKAVKANKEETVKKLLEWGADPNLPEPIGLKGTPLMYACSTDSIRIMELLIEHGADVNQIDTNGDPAINWATYYGNIPGIEFLLKKGADPSLESKHGNTADVALRLWHDLPVYRVFYDIGHFGKWKTDAKKLFQALENGDHHKARSLLTQFPSVANGRDPLGTPLLQLAAQKGDQKMVDLLLEFGADPNAMNRVGQTPLAFAARFGHLNIVKTLVEHGADVNLAGKKYRLTPLMGAAVNGSTIIGKYLIDHGANVNADDVINGCEPMHWAMFYGNIDFVNMMVDQGGDIFKSVLGDKYDALGLAQAYGFNDLVKRLEAKGKEQLQGSWRVDEIHYQYTDTVYVQKEVKYGRFLFTKDHYSSMYNPNLSPRKPFHDLAKPTEEEIISGFQSIKFNSGTYSIANGVLHTKADIAKVPGFEGGSQFFKIVAGPKDKLELTMFDESYPDGSKPEWFNKLQIKLILYKEQIKM